MYNLVISENVLSWKLAWPYSNLKNGSSQSIGGGVRQGVGANSEVYGICISYGGVEAST